MKWIALVVALLLTVSTTAASDDVREYGNATVGYSGKSLHVIATYDYAQVNHDGEWLVFQIGVKTDKAQWLRTRDLEMHTPDGHVIDAPTQREVSRNVDSLYPAVQSISAFGTETMTQMFGCIPVVELSTEGLRHYQWMRGGCEDVNLWVIYRSQTTDHIAINDRRLARMFVFFQSPEGWPAGEYTFVLRGKDDTARLPVRLR